MLLHLLTSKTPSNPGYRYWRLLANDISWVDPYGDCPYFHAVPEYRFFESADASGTNVVSGKTAFSNVEYSSASLACDGNTATYWQSNGSAADSRIPYWLVDLGAGNGKNIRSMQLVGYSVTGFYAKQYLLQKSNDGSSWTTVATINTANTTSVQTFTSLA